MVLFGNLAFCGPPPQKKNTKFSPKIPEAEHISPRRANVRAVLRHGGEQAPGCLGVKQQREGRVCPHLRPSSGFLKAVKSGFACLRCRNLGLYMWFWWLWELIPIQCPLAQLKKWISSSRSLPSSIIWVEFYAKATQSTVCGRGKRMGERGGAQRKLRNCGPTCSSEKHSAWISRHGWFAAVGGRNLFAPA